MEKYRITKFVIIHSFFFILKYYFKYMKHKNIVLDEVVLIVSDIGCGCMFGVARNQDILFIYLQLQPPCNKNV